MLDETVDLEDDLVMILHMKTYENFKILQVNDMKNTLLQTQIYMLHMYICTYVRMYVCTYVRTYVRTYVC